MFGNLDLAILYFFNHKLANPVLDWFFLFIAESKTVLIPLLILLAILFWKGSLRVRLAIILALVCVALLDPATHYWLKPLFGRSRPCHVLDDLRMLIGCGGKYGFPSNHAVNSFAAATMLTIFIRKYFAVYATIAFLIGCSRIYLGRHYPSDVVAGAIVGIIGAFAILYLIRAGLRFIESCGILRIPITKALEAMSWKK
jgi:undecaprenyl-diphosphatase